MAPLNGRGTFSRRTGTMNDISHPRDYERSDADPRLIGALALGIAIFLLVTPYVLLAVYPNSAHRNDLQAELPQPPAPRLQVHPKADLDRLHAEERERLTAYGWVDRERRIVRIPIEQAMDLLAARGIAGWPSPPPHPTPR
jgi:hypothetical protein